MRVKIASIALFSHRTIPQDVSKIAWFWACAKIKTLIMLYLQRLDVSTKFGWNFNSR